MGCSPAPSSEGDRGLLPEGVSHALSAASFRGAPGLDGAGLAVPSSGLCWFSAGADVWIPGGRETSEGFVEEVALELVVKTGRL